MTRYTVDLTSGEVTETTEELTAAVDGIVADFTGAGEVPAPEPSSVDGGTHAGLEGFLDRIAENDSGPGGIYARLEEAGHVLDRFVEEVAARMPTPTERRALQLGPGVPVLTVVRTAFDTSGTAVEVCDTVKAAYAYVLEYDFPAR